MPWRKIHSLGYNFLGFGKEGSGGKQWLGICFSPSRPNPSQLLAGAGLLKCLDFFLFLNNGLSGFGSALAWVQGLALMSLVPTGCETKAEIHSSSSFSPYPLQSAPNQSPPFPSALPPSHSSAFCSSSLVNLGGAAVHINGF